MTLTRRQWALLLLLLAGAAVVIRTVVFEPVFVMRPTVRRRPRRQKGPIGTGLRATRAAPAHPPSEAVTEEKVTEEKKMSRAAKAVAEDKKTSGATKVVLPGTATQPDTEEKKSSGATKVILPGTAAQPEFLAARVHGLSAPFTTTHSAGAAAAALRRRDATAVCGPVRGRWSQVCIPDRSPGVSRPRRDRQSEVVQGPDLRFDAPSSGPWASCKSMQH